MARLPHRKYRVQQPGANACADRPATDRANGRGASNRRRDPRPSADGDSPPNGDSFADGNNPTDERPIPHAYERSAPRGGR